MDKEVYEVRLAGWKQVVQQCQERPAGTTQKEWLAQNEISEAQFYYWLRKVRKEALTEIDLTKMRSFDNPSASAPAAAVIRFGQLSVELSNNADEHLISGILRAVSHAC